MLSGFIAALPIIKMVLELLIKTPEERLDDVSRDLSRRLSEVRDGVDYMRENPGDTSSIEDAINHARRKSK